MAEIRETRTAGECVDDADVVAMVSYLHVLLSKGVLPLQEGLVSFRPRRPRRHFEIVRSALGLSFEIFVMVVLKIIHLVIQPVLSLEGMSELPPIGVMLSENLDEMKANLRYWICQYWKDHDVDVDLLLFHSSFAEDGRPSAIALDFHHWLKVLRDVSNAGECPTMHIPGLRESGLGKQVFEVSTNNI
jgi:hypothetical protein